MRGVGQGCGVGEIAGVNVTVDSVASAVALASVTLLDCVGVGVLFVQELIDKTIISKKFILGSIYFHFRTLRRYTLARLRIVLQFSSLWPLISSLILSVNNCNLQITHFAPGGWLNCSNHSPADCSVTAVRGVTTKIHVWPGLSGKGVFSSG